MHDSQDNTYVLIEHRAELKSINGKLNDIGGSLEKLLSKIEAMNDQITQTTNRVVELEAWKRAEGIESKLAQIPVITNRLDVLDQRINDYEKVKADVTGLNMQGVKYTVYISIIIFLATALVGGLIKFLFHI